MRLSLPQTVPELWDQFNCKVRTRSEKEKNRDLRSTGVAQNYFRSSTKCSATICETWVHPFSAESCSYPYSSVFLDNPNFASFARASSQSLSRCLLMAMARQKSQVPAHCEHLVQRMPTISCTGNCYNAQSIEDNACSTSDEARLTAIHTLLRRNGALRAGGVAILRSQWISR